eukprot:jgi/Ulvmu1/11351/UM075_0011.1
MDHAEFVDAGGGTGLPEQLEDHDEAELADLGLGPEEDAAPDQQPQEEGGYDDGEQIYADEAEEEQAPVATAAMRRNQREHEQRLALLEQVKALNIKMEKAIDNDQRDVRAGRPGPRKLAMISEIEEVAKNVRAQPMLVQSGFVGLLKGFLEPLETAKRSADGRVLRSLPHMQVRNMVYRLLAVLPISTQSQEGRNTLKTSNIGPVLRFYAQVRHEKESNRRFVNDLLNRWMSPIIEEGRKANRDADAERAREQELHNDVIRRREVDREQEKLEKQRRDQKKNIEIGDPSYQYHARVPRQKRPDYIKVPQSSFVDLRTTDGGKVNKKGGVKQKLNAATRKLVQNNKLGAASSTKVETATKNVGNEMT